MKPEFDHYKLAALVEKIRVTQLAFCAAMTIGIGVIIGILVNIH